MLPDDINDRDMDSLQESSADPFQNDPTQSTKKERLSGASWLRGASKLRGSSPFNEGLYILPGRCGKMFLTILCRGFTSDG